MKEFRTPYNYDSTIIVDDTDYSEVVTIPDQAPPLSELLYRFMDGEDVSQYLRDGYEENDDYDDDDFSDLPEEQPGFDLADFPAVMDSLKVSDNKNSNTQDVTPSSEKLSE